MNNVLNIIKNNGLTFEQKINSLAKEAENSICVLDITKKTQEYLEKGIICDLFEGNIPFRPRYIVPDYEKFMKNLSNLNVNIHASFPCSDREIKATCINM